MAKLITSNLKKHIITELMGSNAALYVVLGKPTPFVNGGDASPPTPVDSTVDAFINVYDQAIVGKVVSPYNFANTVATSDMQYMIPRKDWVSGTGYVAYEDGSDVVDYVGVTGATSYDVFKCIGNTSGLDQVLSTQAPALIATSASDDTYFTSDGYQWKYMYSVPLSLFNKFATADYIPVFHDADVRTNANDGGIERIKVTYAGSHYNATTGGTIQATNINGNTYVHQIETIPGGSYYEASSSTNFYVGSAFKVISGSGAGELRTITQYDVSGSIRLVHLDSPIPTLSSNSQYEISPKVIVSGDGSGFVGRALVNTASSNTIYAIDVVNVGSGYRHATATLQGNTSGTSNVATLDVSINPVNGHGYDPISELQCQHMCIATTFNSADVTANTKILDENQFRTISVIRQPRFANVYLTLTSTSLTFAVGESVVQTGTGATGTVVARTSTSVTLTDVLGNFIKEPAGSGGPFYPVAGQTSGASGLVVTVENNGSDPLDANTTYVNMTWRFALSASATFNQDESVSFTSSNDGLLATGEVYFANTTEMWCTNVQGNVPTPVLGETITIASTTGTSRTAEISTSTPPDIVYGSGDVLYINNISPINKSTGQTETVKVILEF